MNVPKTTLTREQLKRLLETSRESRHRYIVETLEMLLGRKPTDAEIALAFSDFNTRKELHQKWLAARPWHTKKRHMSKSERLFRVITKRYGVPGTLLAEYIKENSDCYW